MEVNMNKSILIIILSCLLFACTSIPTGVTPVKQFDLDRYLGTWYEIARIDNRFERGLSKVTATYSLREDGGVTVLNRGYNAEDNEWKEAEGKAYFVGDKDIGHMKVAFWGPFYASYIVLDTDASHQEYAFVSGHNKEYLWLLSRTPQVSNEILTKFMALAESQQYNTDDLIQVKH